jgi:hypothetical protein
MRDFHMRHRADGVQDLPVIRQRETDVPIFKGYLYCLQGDAAGVFVLRNFSLGICSGNPRKPEEPEETTAGEGNHGGLTKQWPS